MERLTDLRFVIGVFFFIAGLILLLASFAGHSDKENASQINMYASLLYMVFGFGMWFSSRKPIEE